RRMLTRRPGGRVWSATMSGGFGRVGFDGEPELALKTCGDPSHIRLDVNAAMSRLKTSVLPASGAVVMATGILSVGFWFDDREALSGLLLVIAAAMWLGLGLLLSDRVCRDWAGLEAESASPSALTGIAGTAVLGTGLALRGWSGVAFTLLAIGV